MIATHCGPGWWGQTHVSQASREQSAGRGTGREVLLLKDRASGAFGVFLTERSQDIWSSGFLEKGKHCHWPPSLCSKVAPSAGPASVSRAAEGPAAPGFGEGTGPREPAGTAGGMQGQEEEEAEGKLARNEEM